MVCRQQMQIFKYLLVPKGEIYISTDVQELFEYMCKVFDESGLWEIKKDAATTEIQPKNLNKADNLFVEKEEIENTLFEMCYKDTDEAHRAGIKSGHTFGRIYKLKE